MKILRVISSVDPRYGGPIEGLKLSSSVLATLGHETEVVSLDEPNARHVADFPFPVHPIGKWIKKYGYTPGLAKWIEANGHRFDAAVVHGLWNHASVGGWQGLTRAGLPYVVFTHGMMDPWFKTEYPAKHLAKQAFWSLFQGKVLRDAETVLFTCEEERRLASGVFSGHSYKERVVAYGTAKPHAGAAGDEEAFRNLVPNLGDRSFLLFMSRIHPKKGCDLLVSAFAEIAEEWPDIDLVIAGPDQVGLRSELEELARTRGIGHRIHWPGMLSGETKSGALRSAEAMVLPSHQENFGIVVAEALAHRCPVLISDKVNIWREIKDAGAGFVSSDTIEGAEEVMRNYLQLSDEQKEAMRRAGFELFEDRFNSVAAARDLEIVLNEISRPAMPLSKAG